MYGKYTYFSAPTGAERIDLGGHTLTVSLEGSCRFYFPTNMVVENGTMVFRKLGGGSTGGYLWPFAGALSGSSTLNLVMEQSAMHLDEGSVFSVSNYVALYTGGYNSGHGILKVYGTFTPAAQRSSKDAFYGPEMQGGSHIDLSAKTEPFSAVALGFTGSGNMAGNRTMTFANEATVGVLLGERKLGKEEQIIDWSAAVPENRSGLKFYGEFADGKRINLIVRDDGVYAPKKGMTVTIR